MRERGLKFVEIGVTKLPHGRSLPMRERGLKFSPRRVRRGSRASLPMRERGLKSFDDWWWLEGLGVAPHAGAWIEIPMRRSCAAAGPASLPMRERGLKYRIRVVADAAQFVAPHAGAWIEIFAPCAVGRAASVAPHAGAWIEMGSGRPPNRRWSGRSPCGSVD